MDYISASEASAKWGVSLRQVQRLLAGGRIPRAKKYGRSWMVPRDAEKPPDPRGKTAPPRKTLPSDLAGLVYATTVPMPYDDPDAILETLGEERERLQYEGELAYLRGDFGRTLRCYQRMEGDDAARLRACPLTIAAAISLGDYRAYDEISAYLKGIAQACGDRGVLTAAELALATAAVSIAAPAMAPEWLKAGDFGAIIMPARPNAVYLRAKYFHCTGNLEAMLASAQTALALGVSEQGLTMTDIYLRVTCAVACYSLGRAEEARQWLTEAMRICLPHGFITPFAEVVTALGGLVEQCLEQSFPAYRGAVIEQWRRTWKNWTSFHNEFTKDNITLMLSLREYHIALLASRRVPYAQIAEQYNISVGRLKNIMLDIYGKLFISGRDELAKYVY
jgi:DNA-binding CsgD family transcriptional regulator